MPDLDGIEVCRRLKLNTETRHIGVIVITAHLTKLIEDDALAAGALTCVSKPLDLKVLLTHLGLLQQPLGG